MSNFAAREKAPRALTERELAAVLRVSGEHVRGFRDHLIIALAAGAGLREHEIAALNIGDVMATGERATEHELVRRRLELRVWKGHRRKTAKGKPPKPQHVVLSDECRRKLNKWLWLLARSPNGGWELGAPLFASRQNARISLRMIRAMWARWQTDAGFEELHPFHDLRHTYVTAVYRKSGNNIRLAQRLARHSRIETTAIYAHPSEDEVLAVARKM